MTGSADCNEMFREIIPELAVREYAYALYLNRANNVIGYSEISVGGIHGTVVDSRLVLKPAIEKLATSVILCHNHPSGNLRPSTEDIQMTKALKQICSIVKIPLLDHLILTEDGYYSFADEGML